MEDSRVFARIDTRIPLRFLGPAAEREAEAEIVDVSANGLGFITEENLTVKTPLEMWLDIPDQRAPLYTRGEVVWSKRLSETKQQRVGVRLENARLTGLARVLWLKKRT